MKPCLWSILLIITYSGFSFSEEPKKYAVERYSVIWQSSKFAKKSEGKVRPNDYRAWILGGVFYMDGHDTAVIINEATGAVEEVVPKKKSLSGLTLLQVVRGPNEKPIRIEVEDAVRKFWIGKTPAKIEKASDLTEQKKEEAKAEKAFESAAK